jgi:hypothetical protein
VGNGTQCARPFKAGPTLSMHFCSVWPRACVMPGVALALDSHPPPVPRHPPAPRPRGPFRPRSTRTELPPPAQPPTHSLTHSPTHSPTHTRNQRKLKLNYNSSSPVHRVPGFSYSPPRLATLEATAAATTAASLLLRVDRVIAAPTIQPLFSPLKSTCFTEPRILVALDSNIYPRHL